MARKEIMLVEIPLLRMILTIIIVNFSYNSSNTYLGEGNLEEKQMI